MGIAGQYWEIRATLGRDPGVEATPVLFDLTIQCCETPEVTCSATLVHIGDDDDSDDDVDADDDDDSDDLDDGCTLEVAWTATSPTDCDLVVDAVVDIGCRIIPVELGQIISLHCHGPDDDDSDFDDDDSDDDSECSAGDCSFDFVNGVLRICSDTAVLIVTATDEEGNTASCELDLCPICPVGDDDDSNGDGPVGPGAGQLGGVSIEDAVEVVCRL